MKFIADFHIHSHYSIATSSQLIPEYLDHWGRIKGIKIVGTGDFTHPGWTEELKQKLEPAEPGLFRLKKGLRITDEMAAPVSDDDDVRFILTAEISNIYKKADKTRKVHNIIFAPDFETVEKIQQTLRQHNFNITSDGRPILGIDSRDLLEICLNASEEIFFVPAHIWTPWFSALGSKSGFDNIEECYGDLSHHIHAVETGLSSDPPMNWLCSFLDKFTLISNSDAHSPEKLGREGNLFDTEISYPAIIDALKQKDETRFLGTLELFPQEGKYHHDGHRKCGISWEPHETLENHGICPVCGKKVTVGVLHRVVDLADRSSVSEHTGFPFHSLIPLKEILSEMLCMGPNAQQITRMYNTLIRKLGSEFNILLHLPLDQIKRTGNDLLAEGIRRMREGKVILQPGYDGEYGVIKVFGEDIRNGFGSQETLFREIISPKSKHKAIRSLSPKKRHQDPASAFDQNKHDEPGPENIELNPDQLNAMEHIQGPALILAGPGTGKTRVLTRRIVHLVREKHIHPANILAVTFTNKAAQEMKERLEDSMSRDQVKPLTISTFHALGVSILKAHARLLNRSSDFGIIGAEEQEELLKELVENSSLVRPCIKAFSEHKQHCKTSVFPDLELDRIYQKYESSLIEHHLFDLDDLIADPVILLRENPEICRGYQEKFQWILVDEYQDINEAQYQLIRLLCPHENSNLYVIGDPNQAIYGFRGADVHFIRRFQKDYPGATLYPLHMSYRCSNFILKASSNILRTPMDFSLNGLQDGIKIQIVKTATDKSEAEFVARTIEMMMGGLRFFSMDSDITEGHADAEWGLSDFAVLCRIGRQLPAIEKAFHDHSIPYQSIGDESFFKKKSVRSIFDILRASQNPEDVFFINRIPDDIRINRDGFKTIQAHQSIKDKLEWIEHTLSGKILDMTPEIWKTLIASSEPFGSDIWEFFKTATLGSPIDTYQPVIERVTLMTLHAAKGLEFPIVFIVGCEDGLLPFHLWDRTADIDEERRLLYVGMTRTRTQLYLTHAEKRTLMGKTLAQKRSPFLDNIEKELLEYKQRSMKTKHRPKDNQLGLF